MNRVEIYLDANLLDSEIGAHVEMALLFDKITQLDYPDKDIKKIRVPASARNREIMGHFDQILDTGMFNQAAHRAEIMVEGQTILEGRAMLAACDCFVDGEVWYLIDIIIDVPSWYTVACNEILKNVPIPFEALLTGDLIKESWTWDLPIRFLPVQRDRYDLAEYQTEVAPVRVMTYEDYHPFVNIRALLDAVVGAEGYSIVSGFMDGDFFKSLYMSGFYPEKDIEILKYRMNFLAGKYVETSAVANSFGSVFTSAVMTANSLGNIVDSADPYVLSGGKRVPGAFDNGKCFKTINSRSAFVPTQDVVVGFEYHFVYSCNFEVISATELRGFTKIKLDDGIVYNSNSANIISNKKGIETPSGSYTLFIFNYDSTKNYQLVLMKEGNLPVIKSVKSAKFEFSWSQSFTPLVNNNSTGGEEIEYAVYDTVALREATQNVIVDVTLRSRPSLKRQNQPVYFDFVTFSGANPGEAMALHDETSVRPIFYTNYLEGDTVTTAQLFAHSNRQIELFGALKHLFNLRFYSDTISKKLYIEPFDDFYSAESVIDWSGKVVLSKPIRVEDLGSDRSETVAMLYTDDDGATMRWNEKYKAKFARWESSIKNLFAKRGVENCVNPLFAPSINVLGSFPQARSASLINVGDRDRRGENYDDGNLNFAPKIVSYMGMYPLKSDESWGYPSYSGSSYPLVAFNFNDNAGKAVSLCFDDYNGVSGLNKYHKSYFETLNSGKKITLSLFLDSTDIESLIDLSSEKRDVRALFKLQIGGEDIYCRLAEISGYSTDESKSSLCVFIYP